VGALVHQCKLGVNVLVGGDEVGGLHERRLQVEEGLIDEIVRSLGCLNCG
jgi:hypothetical protein